MHIGEAMSGLQVESGAFQEQELERGAPIDYRLTVCLNKIRSYSTSYYVLEHKIVEIDFYEELEHCAKRSYSTTGAEGPSYRTESRKNHCIASNKAIEH